MWISVYGWTYWIILDRYPNARVKIWIMDGHSWIYFTFKM